MHSHADFVWQAVGSGACRHAHVVAAIARHRGKHKRGCRDIGGERKLDIRWPVEIGRSDYDFSWFSGVTLRASVPACFAPHGAAAGIFATSKCSICIVDVEDGDTGMGRSRMRQWLGVRRLATVAAVYSLWFVVPVSPRPPEAPAFCLCWIWH